MEMEIAIGSEKKEEMILMEEASIIATVILGNAICFFIEISFVVIFSKWKSLLYTSYMFISFIFNIKVGIKACQVCNRI